MSIESLRRQVANIRAQLGRPEDPKHWVLTMPEGSEIPECIDAQLGPYDTVVIVEVMPAYFDMLGPDESDSCTVTTTHGNYIVSMEKGEWTAVKQPVTHARRR